MNNCDYCTYIDQARCPQHTGAAILPQPPLDTIATRVSDCLTALDRVAGRLATTAITFLGWGIGTGLLIIGAIYVVSMLAPIVFRHIEDYDVMHYYQGVLMMVAGYYLVREA